ncbi:MAG: isoprenoid biosynthesis glyoxalase ElbB [Bacteroidales bacterium]|nr:isoprenoid biosynthesis glyoxalase ElbB [Candidatus Colimorpha onthohippi]
MKNIALILSGCGNLDGSELQESLSLMLAIDRMGWHYQCFAPEGYFETAKYVDTSDPDEGHEEGEIVAVERRNIFEEAARVSRGDILPLNQYSAADYDALCLPGGFGAARNLSTFAFDGTNMTVIDSVVDAILATYRSHKPICAMCIAPMIVAKVLGRNNVHITLGNSHCEAAQAATTFGAIVEDCGATDVCVDSQNKIITTPAYMVQSHISLIFEGGANLIGELKKMIG